MSQYAPDLPATDLSVDLIDGAVDVPLIGADPTTAAQFDGDASDVPYAPGTPGDWDTPPTDVSRALDELAGRESSGDAGNWVVYDLTVPADDVAEEDGLKVTWNFPAPGLLTVRIPDVDELAHRTHLAVYDRTHDVALTDWAAFNDWEPGLYTGSAGAGDDLTFTVSWGGD